MSITPRLGVGFNGRAIIIVDNERQNNAMKGMIEEIDQYITTINLSINRYNVGKV